MARPIEIPSTVPIDHDRRVMEALAITLDDGPDEPYTVAGGDARQLPGHDPFGDRLGKISEAERGQVIAGGEQLGKDDQVGPIAVCRDDALDVGEVCRHVTESRPRLGDGDRWQPIVHRRHASSA
jgi:hypothetical protein